MFSQNLSACIRFNSFFALLLYRWTDGPAHCFPVAAWACINVFFHSRQLIDWSKRTRLPQLSRAMQWKWSAEPPAHFTMCLFSFNFCIIDLKREEMINVNLHDFCMKCLFALRSFFEITHSFSILEEFPDIKPHHYDNIIIKCNE